MWYLAQRYNTQGTHKQKSYQCVTLYVYIHIYLLKLLHKFGTHENLRSCEFETCSMMICTLVHAPFHTSFLHFGNKQTDWLRLWLTTLPALRSWMRERRTRHRQYWTEIQIESNRYVWNCWTPKSVGVLGRLDYIIISNRFEIWDFNFFRPSNVLKSWSVLWNLGQRKLAMIGWSPQGYDWLHSASKKNAEI